MTEVACPDCAGPTRPWHTVRDRNRRTSRVAFSYVRCTNCGLIHLPDVPDDLARYYPSDYYALPASREELVRGARPHDEYKVGIVSDLVGSGRLVEIGPAIGGFSALAQDAGYEVSAIEMDTRAAQFLRDVVGVPTENTDDIESALGAGAPFDVIALWHVIEHVRDPKAVIAAAAASLSPGGVLVLAAPNPDAFQLRVLRRAWTHIDAPRHLFLIPVGSLRRWAADAGLEVELVTSTDEGTLGWNRFGWRETLAHTVRHVKTGHALRLVGSALAAVAGPAERRDLRGSTYTVALRRPA